MNYLVDEAERTTPGDEDASVYTWYKGTPRCKWCRGFLPREWSVERDGDFWYASVVCKRCGNRNGVEV